MKILCPECNHSVTVPDGGRELRCPSCNLTADLSRMGTSPGVTPAAMTRDLSGEELGGYRLVEVIGIGGMGVVYRAVRTLDGAEVAVKILSCASVWEKEAFLARFEREIRTLYRLEHPHIVRIMDSGTEGDIHYLVTEYIRGESLAERMRRGTMTSQTVIDVMEGVLEAISYAHEKGVVHRDIKPANILLSDAGVKVLDFGLAQISSKERALTTLTRTNLAMGTFNYLSPEQRTDAKAVDGRSDLFSLGVVLFEMLTGALPLGNFQPPSRVNAEVDKRFDKVVAKSLDPDPDARYQTAKQFTDALPTAKPGAGPRRWLVAAALLGVVGVSAAGLYDRRGPEEPGPTATAAKPVEVGGDTTGVAAEAPASKDDPSALSARPSETRPTQPGTAEIEKRETVADDAPKGKRRADKFRKEEARAKEEILAEKRAQLEAQRARLEEELRRLKREPYEDVKELSEEEARPKTVDSKTAAADPISEASVKEANTELDRLLTPNPVEGDEKAGTQSAALEEESEE